MLLTECNFTNKNYIHITFINSETCEVKSVLSKPKGLTASDVMSTAKRNKGLRSVVFGVVGGKWQGYMGMIDLYAKFWEGSFILPLWCLHLTLQVLQDQSKFQWAKMSHQISLQSQLTNQVKVTFSKKTQTTETFGNACFYLCLLWHPKTGTLPEKNQNATMEISNHEWSCISYQKWWFPIQPCEPHSKPLWHSIILVV